MCPVRDDGHDRAVRAGQPHVDVAVVVQAGHRDIPGADDLSTLIVRNPYAGHAPCLLPPASHSAGLVTSVPASSASTSPTVRSRTVGSGSGRCAWMR
jgi:hypothetical protein